MFRRFCPWLCLSFVLSPLGCGKTAGEASAGSASKDCKPPAMACGKVCTNIASDPEHCGACGTACPSGDPCVRGACASTNCPAGQTDCGGLCVDVKTNPLNCGSCNTACTPPERCAGGSCECAGTARICGGVCTDVQSSASDCGDCGHPCPVGESCNDGTCVSACAPGYTSCDGRCADLTTDATACGDCRTTCGQDGICAAGRCQCPNDGRYAVCEGACINVSEDDRHCGSCSNACSASDHCFQSHCVACSTGFFLCPPKDGDQLAACLSQAQGAGPPAPGGPDGSPPLSADRTCQCKHCLVELQDCANDPACIAAYQCATTKGCTDHCFDTMGVCSMSGISVGGCWKFCPPTPTSTEGAMHAEALLRCTGSNGCGI